MNTDRIFTEEEKEFVFKCACDSGCDWDGDTLDVTLNDTVLHVYVNIRAHQVKEIATS